MVRASHYTWSGIRVLLSAALLFFALARINWSALLQASYSVQPAWLLLAWVSIFLANLLSGLRWSWLLQGVQAGGGKIQHVGLYFAGALINQGVPTVIGGDAFRALQVVVPGSKREAVLTVVLDRSLGLLGNCLLGAIGLLGSSVLLGHWALWLGGALLVVPLMVFVLVDVLLGRHPVDGYLSKFFQRLHMPSACNLIQRAFSLPGGLAQAVLALLIHVLTLLALEFCLLAFDVRPPLPILMVWLSVLSLLLMLPVSAAGWGVRETALASVLVFWEMTPGTSVLASICYGLITLTALLPGLPWLLRGKPSCPPVSSYEHTNRYHALD